MGNYNLNIPAKDISSPESRNSWVSVLNNIKNSFGKSIAYSAYLTKVPSEVIASSIAVLSGGNPNARKGQDNQGLMAWDYKFMNNIVQGEKRMGRISPSELDYLKKFNLSFPNDGFALNRRITPADQLNSELNIFLGSMYLGQLLDSYHSGGNSSPLSKSPNKKWAIDNGTIRLDRVIGVYLTGPRGEENEGKIIRLENIPSSKALTDKLPSILSTKIKSLVGLNGALDVTTKELANQFVL